MSAQLDGALPTPKGIDVPLERPARGVTAGDLNLLTLIGDNKLAKLGATNKEKSEADDADSEAGDMISRLQTDPVEPGAAELAKKLTSAALRSDAKTLEKLVTVHKKDDAFEDAIALSWDALKETGVDLSWHSDHERLLLSRFPSIWANGPKGAGFSVSAKGEKMETYKIERRPLDPLGIDEGYKFEETAQDPSAVASDLAKSASKALADRRKEIQAAIESVKLHGAIEHAGGFDKVPEGKDEVTPLATALLEKRFSPLLRAVQSAGNDGVRTKLAEDLDKRLSAVGMHATFNEKDGFCVYTFSEGLVDGYSIQFPAAKGGRIQAFELRGPSHSEPKSAVPAVHRIFEHGKDVEEATLSDAMRGFYRKVRLTQSGRTY